MKQFTQKEFIKIVQRNGYSCKRHSGGHTIYVNKNGNHISVPRTIASVIALRLIKENNLNINTK